MTGGARPIGGAGALLPGSASAQTPPDPGRCDRGPPMMGWGGEIAQKASEERRRVLGE